MKINDVEIRINEALKILTAVNDYFSGDTSSDLGEELCELVEDLASVNSRLVNIKTDISSYVERAESLKAFI